jgi:hypothetical protein
MRVKHCKWKKIIFTKENVQYDWNYAETGLFKHDRATTCNQRLQKQKPFSNQGIRSLFE